MTDQPEAREPTEGPRSPERREVLRRLGVSGAVLLGGAAGGAGAQGIGRLLDGERAEATDDDPRGLLSEGTLPGQLIDVYGGAFDPPPQLTVDDLDARATPPPFDPGAPKVRDIEIRVTAEQIEIANGLSYEAWLYNGTAPGPTLRANEGDLLRIHFRNLTGKSHNLHFHGRHSVAHDGWQPIPPGGETVYEIEAGPAGFHPYHCHVSPIGHHIQKGLYGMLIVDPPGGRPEAHERQLILSSWDPRETGTPELFTWNGIAGGYAKFPIRVPVGEPIRLFVLNMAEGEPIASFHVHAETFDVFPSGTSDVPSMHTDVVAFTQTERAILELTFPEKGRYMFHPHQSWIADRGAMGWFTAV